MKLLYKSFHYWLNKSSIKRFNTLNKSKGRAYGKLKICIYIQNTTTNANKQSLWFNTEESLNASDSVVYGHLFFTDMGIFLTDENQENYDFINYNEIKKFQFKNRYSINNIKIYLNEGKMLSICSEINIERVLLEDKQLVFLKEKMKVVRTEYNTENIDGYFIVRPKYLKELDENNMVSNEFFGEPSICHFIQEMRFMLYHKNAKPIPSMLYHGDDYVGELLIGALLFTNKGLYLPSSEIDGQKYLYFEYETITGFEIKKSFLSSLVTIQSNNGNKIEVHLNLGQAKKLLKDEKVKEYVIVSLV